jgi:hypothetical protein
MPTEITQIQKPTTGASQVELLNNFAKQSVTVPALVNQVVDAVNLEELQPEKIDNDMEYPTHIQ